MSYQPPYTITLRSLNLIAEISENLGRLSVLQEQSADSHLRRINRIRIFSQHRNWGKRLEKL